MPIIRIVSGGQTGADRGGLDAASHCSLPHGGFCPKGRLAEDGVIPARYNLVEMPTKDYLARTEANVVDSDATVIFTNGRLEGGSLRTARFAEKHGRPWHLADLSSVSRQQAVKSIVEWVRTECPTECVLNVAGSRESKAPGIRGQVMAGMIDVISKVNGTLFYPADGDTPADDEDGDGADGEDGAEMIATPEDGGQRREPDEGWEPAHHPKTMAEAVQIVLDALDAAMTDRIRAMSDKEKFVIECHFGMGMWIRNNLIHQNHNRIDLYADFQRGCREGRWSETADPDSVSGVICGLVWDALHGG